MSRLENLNSVYKEFDLFTHEAYGESPDACAEKMYKYLRDLRQ